MRRAGHSRRSLLTQLAALGAAGAAFLLVRNHLAWPEPEVRFRSGTGSGWLDLPRSGGLIELPVRIKDVWIRAVVDSGAQYSAIDAALSERMQLPSATPIPLVAFGVSGQPSLTRSVNLDLGIGEDRSVGVAGLRAATLNLASLSGITRQPFSMLLGRDFLRAVVMDVDFPRARVAFHQPGVWRPFAGAVAVPVRERAGALLVQVAVETAAPFEVMVDTGATGALALSEDAARAAGLLDGRRVTRARSVTLGGIGQNRIVRAGTVRFAGQLVRDVPVQIYDPSLKGAIPNGLLGLGLLARHRMGFDLAGRRILLSAPEGPPRRRLRPT